MVCLPMVVVVLGMHRSGTSLVANVLHHLGVHMGDQLLGANRFNPYGHWEDLDFLDLNVEILKAADGDWAHPPSEVRIRSVGDWFRPEIYQLLAWKQAQKRARWGWKDPRTALTAELYHPYLNDGYLKNMGVRYVHVVRKQPAVVDSLMRRADEAKCMVEEWIEQGRVTEEEAAQDQEMAEWAPSRWAALVHDYEGRISQFLVKYQATSYMVRFEDLVGQKSFETVARLARFLGIDDLELVELAAGRIVRDNDSENAG